MVFGQNRREEEKTPTKMPYNQVPHAGIRGFEIIVRASNEHAIFSVFSKHAIFSDG
jgi:hypothetical protein